MGMYTIASGNVLHEKVVLQANGRRLSVENFDEENVDELIKFVNIFPRQNFAPYGMRLEYRFCRCLYFPSYLCMWSNEMIFGATHSWPFYTGVHIFQGAD